MFLSFQFMVKYPPDGSAAVTVRMRKGVRSMKKFILQRTLLALLTLFGITVIVFSLMHLAPGDPVSVIAGRETDAKIIAAIRTEWGFDQPIYLQYFTWLGKALHGNFGMSFVNRMNVT